MRLKQLKLSGFKSFVDSTVIQFPGQLLAVVGPNGCGKSNIIDAVRWVLGESSAKNLRGASMTDVIFNGSTQRKPVGQAFVELIFENHLGRLTGALSTYAEIAIKRQVTREGESSYFLNGSPCRRRDITDIFLGTGANAKGYSIIGQGTISRLVEAKPEDMRVFLEEAAGVSKYKERRKETLLRIRHTRDNLARLADIRAELDKQLQRLEKQAKAAEHYNQLKAQEALCRSEITALKWQALTVSLEKKQQEIKKVEREADIQQTQLVAQEKNKILLNEKVHEANARVQSLQTAYFTLSTEIARLEESLQLQDHEKQRLDNEREHLEKEQIEAEAVLRGDQQALEAAYVQLERDKEKALHLEKDFIEHEEAFNQACAQQALRLKEVNAVHTELEAHKNNLKNKAMILDHVEQRRQDYFTRLDKLHTELASHDQNELKEKHHAMAKQKEDCSVLLEQARQEFHRLEASHQQTQAALNEMEQQLEQTQDQHQQLKVDLSSLEASQKAMLSFQENHLPEQWSENLRLIDTLEVESEWQFACEMVMQDNLNAVLIDSMDELWDMANEIKGFKGQLLTLDTAGTSSSSLPRLSDKIKGSLPSCQPALDAIYLCQSFNEALEISKTLKAYESVISKDGYWLGKGWLKTTKPLDLDQPGVLARQERIKELKQLLSDAKSRMELQQEYRKDIKARIKDQMTQLDQQRASLSNTQEALMTCETEYSRYTLQIQHEEARKTALDSEKEEALWVLENLSEEKAQHETQLEELAEKAEKLQEKLAHLQNHQADDDALNLQKQKLQESGKNLNALKMNIERENIKIQQYIERKNRSEHALEHLKKRITVHMEKSQALDLKVQSQQNTLPDQLERFQQLESQLNQGKKQLDIDQQQLEDTEKSIKNVQNALKQIQATLIELKMDEQTLLVKTDDLMASLLELSVQPQALLDNLPSSIHLKTKEAELLTLIEHIKGLGAINLAAIEEFKNESERKSYLDEQYADLNDALQCLEKAIEKMDKETQSRLKNTFDEINASFKLLFPRLFGGGRAQLELTCDNLLEAGIVVMAQPPGKRNSSIHLLSGGEKAMTAMALIFSIFQLNPSPFCMLDEVDAPLDDVNVGRFCDLVREMSDCIQFLFITHNKVTMELADQLIGVTMREPGVSRLVAVDVQHALAME